MALCAERSLIDAYLRRAGPDGSWVQRDSSAAGYFVRVTGKDALCIPGRTLDQAGRPDRQRYGRRYQPDLPFTLSRTRAVADANELRSTRSLAQRNVAAILQCAEGGSG